MEYRAVKGTGCRKGPRVAGDPIHPSGEGGKINAIADTHLFCQDR